MPEAAKLDSALTSAIERMSVPELDALGRLIEQKGAAKLEEAKRQFMTETRAKAAELGLSLETLFTAPPPSKRTPKAPKGNGQLAAKYRGPNGEEWAGRGRTPGWLSALEAEGRKREEFEIRAAELS